MNGANEGLGWTAATCCPSSQMPLEDEGEGLALGGEVGLLLP
jgi:hypothetical protein